MLPLPQHPTQLRAWLRAPDAEVRLANLPWTLSGRGHLRPLPGASRDDRIGLVWLMVEAPERLPRRLLPGGLTRLRLPPRPSPLLLRLLPRLPALDEVWVRARWRAPCPLPPLPDTLTGLHLSRVAEPALAQKLQAMPGLRRLTLHHTPAAALPGALTHLSITQSSAALPPIPPGLRSLTLRGMSLRSPALVPPGGLRVLRLEGLLPPLAPLLHAVPALTHLELCGPRRWLRPRCAPPDLGRHDQLVELRLRELGLTGPPPLPPRLRVLDLSGNHITRLPTLPPGVTALLASNNPLDALPPLAGLVRLHLSQTRIRALPDLAPLAGLQSLSLLGCPLDALPDDIGQLGQLSRLELSRTGLTALPPSIGRLRRLQSLRLKKTPMAALPPELGQLCALQELDLRQTRLTDLEPVAALPSLKSLWVGGAPIAAAPTSPPASRRLHVHADQRIAAALRAWARRRRIQSSDDTLS